MATSTDSYLDELERDLDAQPREENDAPMKAPGRKTKSPITTEAAYDDGIRNDLDQVTRMVSELRDQLGLLEEKINPVLGPVAKGHGNNEESDASPEQAPLRHAIANLKYGIQAAQYRISSMHERVEL
jgi:hypothetical protein